MLYPIGFTWGAFERSAVIAFRNFRNSFAFLKLNDRMVIAYRNKQRNRNQHKEPNTAPCYFFVINPILRALIFILFHRRPVLFQYVGGCPRLVAPSLIKICLPKEICFFCSVLVKNSIPTHPESSIESTKIRDIPILPIRNSSKMTLKALRPPYNS